MKKFTLLKSFFCGLLLISILAAGSALAASAVELNAKADATLKDFFAKVPAAVELTEKSRGMLVFPAVYKAGFGVGAEYGEGVLRVAGKTVDYYSTAGASIGFQLGAQKKSIVILFMTRDALQQFRASQGWEVGVDGSVALIELGVGKDFDTTNIKDPVIGFVFGNKGLMYNLSLEGSKLTRISK
ncbi:MAG: twin-arginine translocation pathway signal protein [Desulfuromonadales bacterium]|nr:twin-arginine translocation pathway signal protein [Desulfuromonadales bacterium]MBN2791737.1 twin-arginine translocation pathway signal protein [Desulfuromonadales bacterium]